MSYRIEDLVTFAADAALAEAEAGAVTARWKAAAIAEAERLRVSFGTVDRFPSGQPGLGVLRLDGADKPAVPTVVKPAAFAEYLAENAPEYVVAQVTLPAAQLKALTDALEWTGITGVTVDLAPKNAAEFLEKCHVRADVDVPGAWRVVTIGEDETLMEIPGVTAVKPAPRWVLTPDTKLKKERAEAALEFVEAQLAEPAEETGAEVSALDADAARSQSGLDEFAADTTHNPTPEPAPAASEALARYTRRGAMTLPELRAACLAAGLPVSGTKPQLQERLTEKLGV